MKKLFKNYFNASFRFFLTWLVLAVFAGALSSFVAFSFINLLEKTSVFITNLNIPPYFIWIIPALSALVTGGVIYRLNLDTAGEGLPSYIHAMKHNEGIMNRGVTFFKYLAALVTLSGFGSGGIVGPVGRVNAGLMSFLTEKLTKSKVILSQTHIRFAAACGLAATVGVVFHSSIGAGIFAVEVVEKQKMNYKELFPAIISSSTAVFISKMIGFNGFYRFEVPDQFMDFTMIGWLALFVFITGIFGAFYNKIYKHISRLFEKKRGFIWRKTLIGCLVAYFIAVAINIDLLGTGQNMVHYIVSGNILAFLQNMTFQAPLALIFFILFLGKIMGNSLVVGSGMSAGFTSPAVIAGMLLALAAVSVLKISIGSPTYYAFLAAGFSGMLACTLNVPIAAAIMALELFGIHYSFPVGLAVVIGFHANRYHTLHDDSRPEGHKMSW